IVLAADGSATDAICAQQPLTINFLRVPPSPAQIEVIPLEDGTLRLDYFTSPAGSAPMAGASQTVPVIAGQPNVIDVGAEVANFRRIDITMPGQIVNLSRLTLLPPEGETVAAN
ncbi:MAG: hypothetical protein GYB67_18885, partial [Chloroflexi bacterium]|nr:hypothetical protein [Chloroflexota bacterium]